MAEGRNSLIFRVKLRQESKEVNNNSNRKQKFKKEREREA